MITALCLIALLVTLPIVSFLVTLRFMAPSCKGAANVRRINDEFVARLAGVGNPASDVSCRVRIIARDCDRVMKLEDYDCASIPELEAWRKRLVREAWFHGFLAGGCLMIIIIGLAEAIWR